MNCCQRHSIGRLCGIEIEVARHHGGPICIGLWTSEPSLFGCLGWKFLGFVAPGAIRLWLRPPWFWCFSSSIGQSEPIKITQPKWGTYEKPRQATRPRIIDDDRDEHDESVINVICEVCVWVRWADWADCGPAQRADRKVHRWYRSKSCGEWVRQGRAWLTKLPSSHPWWTEVQKHLGQVWASASWTSWTDMCLIQSLKHLDGLVASCCVAQIDFCPGNFNFSTFWAKDLRQKCEQVREEFSARRGAFEGVFGRFSALPLGIWIACHKFMGIN